VLTDELAALRGYSVKLVYWGGRDEGPGERPRGGGLCQDPDFLLAAAKEIEPEEQKRAWGRSRPNDASLKPWVAEKGKRSKKVHEPRSLKSRRGKGG